MKVLSNYSGTFVALLSNHIGSWPSQVIQNNVRIVRRKVGYCYIGALIVPSKSL
ncbi:hypothetical protein MY3296_000606 [Beauveria thailandica]